MTTLPNDPPVDDDDWSHQQVESPVEAPVADPDELAAYSEEELEVFADEDIYEKVAGHRVSYPGEDLDELDDDADVER